MLIKTIAHKNFEDKVFEKYGENITLLTIYTDNKSSIEVMCNKCKNKKI